MAFPAPEKEDEDEEKDEEENEDVAVPAPAPVARVGISQAGALYRRVVDDDDDDAAASSLLASLPAMTDDRGLRWSGTGVRSKLDSAELLARRVALGVVRLLKRTPGPRPLPDDCAGGAFGLESILQSRRASTVRSPFRLFRLLAASKPPPRRLDHSCTHRDLPAIHCTYFHPIRTHLLISSRPLNRCGKGLPE
jgi:hypothetical protein